MFVIMVYDAQARRVGKLRKIVKRYLTPVQRSVFQGFLTQKRCAQRKDEIAGALDTEKDSVILYKPDDPNAMTLDEIGMSDHRGADIL